MMIRVAVMETIARRVWLLVSLLLSVYARSVWCVPETASVVQLSDANFAHVAQRFEPLLVLFDRPTRSGSDALRRRFLDAADALRVNHWNASTTMQFAYFNLNANQANTLPDVVRVLGVPALLRFQCRRRDSTATTIEDVMASGCGVEVYDGGRSSAEFQRYMLGQPRRRVSWLSTRRQLDAATRQSPFVALCLVDGADSFALLDCQRLAQLDTDGTGYAATTNVSLVAGVTATPTLVVYRDFGRQVVEYDGVWTRAALSAFIEENRFSAVTRYSRASASYFYDSAALGHVLLFAPLDDDDDDGALADAMAEQAEAVAADVAALGAVVRFVLVPPSEDDGIRQALFVPADQLPAVLAVGSLAQPATRLPVVGHALRQHIGAGELPALLYQLLATAFPLFGPIELPGDGAWRDYRDLFEDAGGLVVAATDEPIVDPSSVGAPRTERVASTDPEELRRRAAEDGDTVLVVFHSRRCGSCVGSLQQIDQLLAQAPTALATLGVDVLATVDLDDVTDRATALAGFDVDLLPAVRLLQPLETGARMLSMPARSFSIPALLTFASARA
ncbi:hypothetical protein P43SY_001306 [Pythium insidiosum]|uniref:Thioredoxin domain-containing protein n=1 Tax=Pythium insidiosum TaxID=114742 RepID=A0AAD5Q953_PYTIN|nr:hypothetical protein P43SY_001306 [Pythium insidiosum]